MECDEPAARAHVLDERDGSDLASDDLGPAVDGAHPCGQLVHVGDRGRQADEPDGLGKGEDDFLQTGPRSLSAR